MIRISAVLIGSVYFGLVAVLFISLVIRTFRWLAVVQEKEYRVDRLRSFLGTRQGMWEVFRVFPQFTELWLRILKRPRLTKRVWATLALVLGLDLISILGLLSRGMSNLVILLVILLVLQPALIMIVSVISTWFKDRYTLYLLAQVSQKLLHSRPTIIGITGSYGKSTTKLLLGYLLKDQASVCMTPGSLNSLLAVAQFILSEYADQEYLVLEYAAYAPGEIAILAQAIPPQVVILTGITPQHLGLFGSLERLIQAKSELPAALPDDGVLLYPAKDPLIAKVAQAAPSTVKRIEVEPTDIGHWQVSDRGTMELKVGKTLYPTPFVGTVYQRNVALAISAARVLGVSATESLEKLHNFPLSEKFISITTLKSGARLIDDGGTSNPEGFTAACQVAKELKADRKILITAGIPDLGSESGKIHAQLAQTANQVFSVVLYTSSLELDTFKKNFDGPIVSDREKSIQMLETLGTTDLVLVEGRVPGWLAPGIKNLRQNS